jgi:chemotaxis protein MotB
MAHGTSSPSPGPSRDRWLVSYADFMTLLFAFFATMYAISSVDARKLTQMASALQVAFDSNAHTRADLAKAGRGVLPEQGSHLIPIAPMPPSEVMARVSRDLQMEILSNRVELTEDRRGLVLSIPEAGTFAIGSDELSPLAQDLVASIASSVTDLPNQIRVEGHTDDVPIHTARFRSNWELSTARAGRVVELLIDRGRITPARLGAAGYGEFRPRVPNESSAARASNRRVDLVILNEATRLAEEPAQGAPPK